MLEKLRRPYILKYFLFTRLPLAWIAGLRMSRLDDESAVTSMPYGWITKNPFRSMYFAAQAMAAEFSTGILAAYHLEKSKANVAMLIVQMESEYFQKVESKVTFTCNDGKLLSEGIKQCIEKNEPIAVKTTSRGTVADGTVVSSFQFTWSFKLRS